jgi:sugar lactone lactonase YvrE
MNGMSLAATPDGRFLIVTDSLLNAFVVNAIAPDGSLSPVGERHLVPDPIGGIKVSPDGRFLALAILSGIAMYAIEPNGHVIPVPGSPFPKTGRGLTTTIDINCDGSLLFATDRGGYSRDEVTEGKAITAHVYAIRPNGSLLHLGATPSIAGFGEFATYLILSPDGRTLFVSDTFASSVAAFRVGISGALSLVPGSPFSIGTIQGFDPNPWGMIMNPSGSLLYFAISRNRVGGFEAARDGSLRVLPTSPTIPRSLEGSSASTLTLAYFPASGCAAPVLTIRNVNFTGKKLAIIGSGLVNSTRVFINGADRTAFVKSISDTKVKLNGKRSALGLTVGDNIVQVTNPDDLLSNVFVLRL